MHFRLATESDRGLVESLWDYCFEHREDPFFQWYFNHFYRPENVLMGFEGDDMACLTHLNPYTLCLRGKAIDTSYIVGLATHPAARRSGVGGKLLTAALKEMKRRGHYIHIRLYLQNHPAFRRSKNIFHGFPLLSTNILTVYISCREHLQEIMVR